MEALFVMGFVALLLALRLLHLASQAVAPTLHFKESPFTREIVKLCPLLSQIYLPPLLWGKSGHIQTLIYGKMGRINSPKLEGERSAVIMEDGATMTYDVFEPEKPHSSGGDYSLLVCPGIANHSQSLYIQTFVHHAQRQGFRVAVLNHLGAPANVALTSPRIFTYGGTEEYGRMVDEFQSQYPDSRCFAVGFSMGGNIVVKWLGEECHQNKVIAGISCGQGYDAEGVMPYLMGWEHIRRAYLWAMAQHQKGVLRRHYDVLFSSQAEEMYKTTFETDRILAATSLVDIDVNYTRKRMGFSNVKDYYRWASCKHVIDNVDIPMFFLNALDDPLVPTEMLDIPRQFVYHRNNSILALTQHGGHLGYFEGGIIVPETITWLDKVVVEYANAVIQLTETGFAEGTIPLNAAVSE